MKLEETQLSQEKLEWVIEGSPFIESAIYYEEIDSTNKAAKEIGKTEESKGMLLLAEYQSNGKGRLDRAWSMPKGKDLMFTILSMPDISITEAPKLTLLMAQAVVRVLRKNYSKQFKVKWPNDITYNGKKICGILTEMNSKQNKINYVVIGVGLNCNTESFSTDLKNKATSLINIVGQAVNRAELLKDIIKEYSEIYAEFRDNGLINILNEIKLNSALIDQEIYLMKDGINKKGKVKDISKDGELLILYESGETEKIISGEVSLEDVYNKLS